MHRHLLSTGAGVFCISRNARPGFNRSVLGGGWAAVSGSCDSDAEQLVFLSRSPVGRSLRSTRTKRQRVAGLRAGRLRPARHRKRPTLCLLDCRRLTEKRSAPRLPHPIPNHPLQPPIRNRISPCRVLPKFLRQAPTGRNRVGLLTIRTGLFAFPPKEHPSAEESYQQLPSLSTARSSAAGRNC